MKTVQPAENLEQGIQNLIDASNRDYKEFCDNESMVNEFVNGWRITNGKKFIKVCERHSVHCFIVKEDFKHFKKGDVLKAASWRAPALNQPRGNVLKGNFPINWTGPLYLR